ncbi:MAG: TIGR02996 domain-containing protein [Myxococcota bacterium]
MTSALDDARHELERARAAPSLEEALLAICRAWARCPSARIAALALRYARAQPAEAVAGPTQKAREARWHELAAAADPADLPTLLATPWTKRPADAIARLEKLGRFPPDPRIVHALLELDTGQRFLSAAGNRFWVLAFEQLLAWGSAEAAARIPKGPPPPGDPMPFAASRFANIFGPVLASWGGRLPVEPTLDAATERLLASLAERIRGGEAEVEQLLSAVWSDAAAEGPRLVLADALTEAGDPRGEFVALQFAHERGELTLGESERMARLLAAGGRRWLGDLDGQVAPPAVFRRGFPAEVRLSTRTPDPERRGWSTVEALDTGGLALALSGFLQGARVRHVRRLLGLSVPTLVELAKTVALPPIGREGRGEGEWALLELTSLAGPDVPTPKFRVDTLRVRGDTESAARWFLGSSLRGRTTRLQLDVAAPPPFVVPQGRLVVERPPSRLPRVGALVGDVDAKGGVEALELVASPEAWPARWAGAWRLTFTRDARGRLGALAIVLESDDTSGLEVLLRGLPDTQLSALSVRTEKRLSPAARETVAELLERALASQRNLVARDVALAHAVPRPPAPVIYDGA